ncbi:MAG: hypothetical protein IJU04_07220 [Ruminococcus sp.]|nr:hypothetical protein [Ruminococcus sp.]
MLNNVGESIKNYAKIILIIILVIFPIAALIMFVISSNTYSHSDSELLIIIGVILLVLIPINAIICTLIYGFGELICNSDEAKKSLKRIEMEKTTVPYAKAITTKTNKPEEKNTPVHKWMCTKCGRMIENSLCPYCGYNHDDDESQE